jgi:hypothetical protein
MIAIAPHTMAIFGEYSEAIRMMLAKKVKKATTTRIILRVLFPTFYLCVLCGESIYL